jgi:hypothetical protein
MTRVASQPGEIADFGLENGRGPDLTPGPHGPETFRSLCHRSLGAKPLDTFRKPFLEGDPGLEFPGRRDADVRRDRPHLPGPIRSWDLSIDWGHQQGRQPPHRRRPAGPDLVSKPSGYFSERNCSNARAWSCRPQFSTTMPFEKRLKPIVLKSIRFPVGDTPRNSPSCVPT